MNKKQLRKNVGLPFMIRPLPVVQVKYEGRFISSLMKDYTWYLEKVAKKYIVLFCGSTGHILTIPNNEFKNHCPSGKLIFRNQLILDEGKYT